MTTVPLYGKLAAGRVALVDDADLPLVLPYRWYAQKSRNCGAYAFTPLRLGRATRRTLFMHTLIMGRLSVDHIDLNGLNNQRSNLRLATASQNGANTRPRGGTSRFKGVYWDRRACRWGAQIHVNQHNRNLGRFTNEEAAARAYDAAAFEAWGEFARLNFPQGDS